MPLVDGRSVPAGQTIESDVCIVGAGPAGITLALELADTPVRTCVVESGGLVPLIETAELNRGRLTGHPYMPLNGCRQRCFGGTSNHWAGWCRPLEAIEFEKRSWVPGPGWPFGAEHLRPYYPRAQELIGLPQPRFDSRSWGHPEGSVPLRLGTDLVRTEVYQIHARDFGQHYRQRLERAPNILTLLFSNATEIVGRPDSRRVSAVRVATLGGNSFDVRARLFVLAAGGLENARLLLLSRSRNRAGLGNESGTVGRHFMEHLHLPRAAHWIPSTSGPDLSYYDFWSRSDVGLQGIVLPSPEITRELRLLGFSATISSRTLMRGMDVYDELLRGVTGSIAESDGLRRRIEANAPVPAYALFCRTEQVPNPESRVTLTDSRDGLGLPQAHLHWELTEQDVSNITDGLRVLARALGRAGLGRVLLHPRAEPDAWVDRITGGCHHMGTTRMSRDPREGVVDPDGKLHTVGNVYVAGSSVFPSVGAANPTFTIVALAVRLADHLKERLG